MAARDQVGQVVRGRALDEAVVVHPVIIEHLRQVLVATVADEGDHALLLGLLTAIFQRRREQRAR